MAARECPLRKVSRRFLAMDERKQLERDIAFANGLLAKDGYHPYMRELLIEAKQKMEEELVKRRLCRLGTLSKV